MKDLTHAQIGTIHGLCSSLLRANPVESDLDPAFTVLEERDHNDFLVTEVRSHLRRLLHEQNQAAALLCDEYGSRSLQEQTISLLQKGFSFARGELTVRYEEELSEILQEARHLQRVVTKEFIAECSSGNRTLLGTNMDSLQRALGDLTKQENLDFLQDMNKGLKRTGKNKADIDAVKTSLDRIAAFPLCATVILPRTRLCTYAPPWDMFSKLYGEAKICQFCHA